MPLRERTILMPPGSIINVTLYDRDQVHQQPAADGGVMCACNPRVIQVGKTAVVLHNDFRN